ncbi:MAG: RNA-binding cell elongation regulator Jag/EloR [Syntrophobacterales bacterium]
MSAMEIEGKSVEEAIETACQRLSLPADQLEIEIVSHGSSGIFGIGTRNAKILVSPKEAGDASSLEEAKEILENILAHIQIPATVEANWVENRIRLDISSNGSGLLIGKRGQTLHSLQFIVNKMFNRLASKKAHIIIDTENYRERRKQALTEVALNLANRAKKSGRPATSSPLSAYDRRIIHLALKDNRQVRTKSKGDGALRKVVVFPVKKELSSKKRSSRHRSSTHSPSDPSGSGEK